MSSEAKPLDMGQVKKVAARVKHGRSVPYSDLAEMVPALFAKYCRQKEQLLDLSEQIKRLRAGLGQAAAALAVAAKQPGAKHPGMADADNLHSVRGFCLEAFHNARRTLVTKKMAEEGRY